MSKLRERVRGFKGFLDDVGDEMRKCTWPERQELIESTVVVIVSVVMLSAFVGLCDTVLARLLKWVVPAG